MQKRPFRDGGAKGQCFNRLADWCRNGSNHIGKELQQRGDLVDDHTALLVEMRHDISSDPREPTSCN